MGTLTTQNLKTTPRRVTQTRRERTRSTSAMSGKQQEPRRYVQSLKNGRQRLEKMEDTLILWMRMDILLKQLQSSKIDLNNLPLKNQPRKFLGILGNTKLKDLSNLNTGIYISKNRR